MHFFLSTSPIIWLAHYAPLWKNWCRGLGCEERSHSEGHMFLSRETRYTQAGWCILLIKKKWRHSVGFIIPSPWKKCTGLHPVSSELGHLLGWNFFFNMFLNEIVLHGFLSPFSPSRFSCTLLPCPPTFKLIASFPLIIIIVVVVLGWTFTKPSHTFTEQASDVPQPLTEWRE